MNLYVCKGSKSLHAAFPAESTATHSSRREHHVRFRDFVHEPHSNSHSVDHLLTARLRVNRAAEPVGRAVGDAYCVVVVLDLVHGEDRSEKLVIVGCFFVRFNESNWVEGLLHVLSRKDDFPGLRHLCDQLGQVAVQIRSGQGAHLCFGMGWVACLDGLQLGYQQTLELVVNLLVDNVSFRGEADLSSVAAPASDCILDCLLHVCVLQHDERIVPTQLHHARFQVFSCCLGDDPSRPG